MADDPTKGEGAKKATLTESRKSELANEIAEAMRQQLLTAEQLLQKREEDYQRAQLAGVEIEKQLNLTKELLQKTGQLTELRKLELDFQQQQVVIQSKFLQSLADNQDKIDEIKKAEQDILDIQKERQEAIQSMNSLTEGLAEKMGIMASKSNNAFVRATAGMEKYIVSTSKQIGLTMAEDVEKGFLPKEVGKALAKDMHAAIMDTFSAFNIGSSIMLSVIQSTIALVKQVDTASASLSAATGAGFKFTKQLAAMSDEYLHLGVSAADLEKGIRAVQFGITGIGKESATTQRRLAETATFLSKIGISADEAASVMNDLMLSFGFAAEEADQLTRDLALMGVAIGVTASKMIADFKASLPVLAMYGSKAEQIFKGIAAQAKAAGVETNQLIGIAEGFQTFSDAAGKAGQLNAILGTQLSTTQLLTMEHDDLIKTLIDEVQVTTGGWENLSKFEKRAIAAAAGITDMNVANKVFKMSISDYEDYQDEMAASAAEQEKMAEAVKAAEPALNRMKMAFLKLAVAIEPMVMGLMNFVENLADFLDKWGTWVMVGGAALFVIGSIVKVLNLMALATQAATAAQIAANTLKIQSILLGGKEAAVNGLVGASFYAKGAAIAFASLKYIAIAAAIGLVAYMIFKKRSSPTFFEGIFLVTAGLIMMGISGIAASKGLIIIAVTIGLTAAAIALMFYSMNEMLGTIAELAPVLDKTIPSLTAFVVGIASAGMAAGPAALGFLGLAAGIYLLSRMEKTIVGLGQFFGSMATIETDTLSLMATKIREIASAIKEIPTSHVIAIGLLGPNIPKIIAGLKGGAVALGGNRETRKRTDKVPFDVKITLDGAAFDKAVAKAVKKTHKAI